MSPTQVIVVGASSATQTTLAGLRAAGITDVAQPRGEVISSRFDDDTHTWELRTAAGETLQGRAGNIILSAWISPAGRC